MCPIFPSENKTPSSSGIESYFKTLKQLVFKTKVQKYRVDEFFTLHSEFLDGEIKSALIDIHNNVTNKATPKKKLSVKRKTTSNKTSRKKIVKRQKSFSLKSDQIFSKDSIFSDDPSYIENWKGEGKCSIKKQKKTKFIKNGCVCQSVNVSGKNIVVTNTCGFDSVMYLLSVGYSENKHVRNIVNTNSTDDLILQYIKGLSDANYKLVDMYTMRARIISQTCKQVKHNIEENTETYNDDDECNVDEIYTDLIINYFYSAIYTKLCSNTSCQSGNIKKTYYYAFLSLNIDIIKVFGISALEEAIMIRDEKKMCLLCAEEVTYEYNISSFISFDLNNTNEQLISDIPQTLKVKDKYYRLIGAIEFIPGSKPDVLGHYKCHCLFGESVITYDDMSVKFHESPTNKPIFLHSLSYGFINEPM